MTLYLVHGNAYYEGYGYMGNVWLKTGEDEND